MQTVDLKELYGENADTEKKRYERISEAMIEKSGHSSWELLQNCWCEGAYKEQRITVALALSNEFIGHDGGVCRVHGGGFAGVILAVIKDSLVSSYVDKMSAVFDRSNVRRIDIRLYGLVKVKDM